MKQPALQLAVLAALTVLAPAVQADAWQDYARAVVTPDFSWADRTVSRVVDSGSLMPSSSLELAQTRFSADLRIASLFIVSQSWMSEGLGADPQISLQLADRFESGLLRESFAGEVSRDLTNSGRISAGIVVANQQFASFGMGASEIVQSDLAALLPMDRSSAAGVRLAYRQPLTEWLSLAASYQSRIDMDAFQSYVGVFSDPGDFDIPAQSRLQAELKIGGPLSLQLGAQQLGYSQLNAFTSYTLPERFLSLLGDGNSPEFAWRDLTVYDVNARFALSPNSQLDLRYSTQQQPEPSSTLLYNALSAELTDRNFAIGYSRRFDRGAELSFAASHAPAEYFLGTSSALRASDADSEQIEVEARFRFNF